MSMSKVILLRQQGKLCWLSW